MSTNDPKFQKAKVTIELEDGSKTEFVAVLHVRETIPCFDGPLAPEFAHDGKWRNDRLPEPPKWEISGRTIGQFVLTPSA